MGYQALRVSPGKALFLLLCCWILMTVLGSEIISFIGMGTVSRLRVAVIIQDIFMMILPVLITSFIIVSKPFTFLETDNRPAGRAVLLTVLLMLVSIPMMNGIVYWNENISFPDSLSGLENVLRQGENHARNTVNWLLNGKSVSVLILGILMVGLLTGFSEELFFRGALQRILGRFFHNPHAAIWATAVIFSAVHLQFFGFVPRILIGALFGYLLWWSRSLWLPVIAHALNNSLVVINKWCVDNGYLSQSLDIYGTPSSSNAVIWVLISTLLSAVLLFCLYRGRERNEL